MTHISVDRIYDSFEHEILRVALDETPADRNLYGWAKLTAKQARDSDCRVKHSPTRSNRFHADIVLPTNISGIKYAEIEKAKELADASEWLARPDKSLEQILHERNHQRDQRQQRAD